MRPLVSIITPSYNQGRYIEHTIQSVLSQDYPVIEYIVIDGRSTDNTLDILRKYEGRLNWVSEKDSGQGEAINKGFRMARGEILAWINSDDVYLPGAVSKGVNHLVEYPDAMMVYGEGYMIDGEGDIKCRFPFTEPRFDLGKLIYEGDYILQQSTFIRRNVFDTIPMLDESLHWTLDWDLFIRIGKRFRVDYIPEYLGCIRVHDDAKSTIGGSRRFREIVQTIREHGVLRYPRSFLNYAYDTYGKNWLYDGASEKTDSKIPIMVGPLRKPLRWLAGRFHERVQQEYYSDGWIGKRAIIVLPNPDPGTPAKILSIEGEAYAPNTPLKITVEVNDTVSESLLVRRAGKFALNISIPPELACSDCYHICVRSSKTFIPGSLGISSDERALGFLLKKIEVSEKP